jgi:DNA adenine methylase
LPTVRKEDGAARPFLKWAGGKSQLLPAFSGCFPAELGRGGVRRYVEPFVGSGAVWLAVAQQYPGVELVIGDLNPALMATYRALQEDVEAVVAPLEAWQAAYWAADEAGRKALYYEVREAFNAALARGEQSAAQAARFVFLNRTGFNGLFRVNAAGRFNVPPGRYRRPRIADGPNLRRVAAVLRRTRIVAGDYRQMDRWIGPGTFVYCDPPYRPLSRTASFTAYIPEGFDDDAQRRLATACRAWADAGAWVMVSNADPRNTDPDDRFFETIYPGFWFARVSARRSINARPDRRGPVRELVITSYPPPGVEAVRVLTAR